MFSLPMTYVWIAAMVVFLVVEAIVPGLVSIWFAIGSLGALVATVLKAPLWLQVTIFILLSVVSLFFTRPLAKKYVNSKTTPTNADAIIGKECVVTKRIDNVMGTGAAKVDGKEWTARSLGNIIIEKETHAIVEAIEGVKIIVKPKN